MQIKKGRAMTSVHLHSLASGMTIPGVLNALEKLSVCIYKKSSRPSESWSSKMIRLLAKALASGAAPSLRHLDLNLGCTFGKGMDKAVKRLAAMLESRALLPACRGLETLDNEDLDRIMYCSEEIGCRFLRAFLPSLTELFLYTTNCNKFDYEVCFVSVGAPRLIFLQLCRPENFFPDGARLLPSAQMLECMPALEILVYDAEEELHCQLPDLEPVILALNRGIAF